MLDFSTKSSSELIPPKTCPKTSSTKCDEDVSNTEKQTKISLTNPELPKQHQKQETGISNTSSFSALSLISPALLTTGSSIIHPKSSLPEQTHSPSSIISTSTMNEKVISSSLTPANVLGMQITASKALSSNSAPSSLKLLPKKFSPFSVDSLLSHKEKQAASDNSNGNHEFSKKPEELNKFSNKEQSHVKVKDSNLSSGSSVLESTLSQNLKSQPLVQDSIGVGHHLAVAKFLLNNNLHERSSSNEGLGKFQSSNAHEILDAKNKHQCSGDNTKLTKYHDRDSVDSQQTYVKKKEINHTDRENRSSHEHDIDVCGDEADIEDEDDEYHNDINDIKSESNYEHMMSEDDGSAAEDETESGEFVKTEDVEEKLELQRQLILSQKAIDDEFPGGDHHLVSPSGISPKQGPVLHPRFPLGFPITSASPNPFSPPSPSSGVGGTSLPRPTPSLPWLPHLRSPLQIPGFIGSKYRS